MKKTIGALLYAGWVAQCALAAAQPQGDATADQGDLQDIVVTATKRSERLSDVPLSITAASGETLARRGISTIGDLEKIAPGFSFTPSNLGAPVFTIRGIGFNDETIAIAPTVSIYVDQIPIPYSRAAEGVGLDLERLEVLKGPQGTLFGQNSTGGAINYIAAKPTNDLRAGISATYGRFNQAEAEAYISGPVSDTLRARLAVRGESRDDWQQSVSRDDSSGKHRFVTGRLLVDWEPSDDLKFEFNANGWKDKSDTQSKQFQRRAVLAADPYPGSVATPNMQALLAALPPAPRNSRAADWDAGKTLERNDSFYQFALRGDWQMAPEITLTSISAYSKTKISDPVDGDGTQYPNFRLTVGGSASTFTQELRVSGSAGENEKLRWTIGGNYQHDNADELRNLSNQTSNSGVGPFRFEFFDQTSDQIVSTTAGFAAVDYKITDSVTASASARYTMSKRTLDGCLLDAGDGELATAFGFLSNVLNGNPQPALPGTPAFIAPGGCATLGSTSHLPVDNVHRVLDEDNWSWRGSLSWKPSAGALIYGTVTKGYKSGSFANVPAISEDQYAPVPQESVLAYEAGFKTALLNRRVQLTGAVFYYSYKDKQVLGNVVVPLFGALPGLVSIPKSRVWGAEIEAHLRPTSQLTMSFGASRISSKVTSAFSTFDPVSTGVEPPVSVKGSAFPDTPRWQVTADGEYRIPVGEGSIYLGGSVLHRSATQSYFASGPEFRVPERTLVDLRAGFDAADDKWGVQVFGKNITNEYYWTTVVRFGDAVSRLAGMPVTYGVTLRYRF